MFAILKKKKPIVLFLFKLRFDTTIQGSHGSHKAAALRIARIHPRTNCPWENFLYDLTWNE